MAVLIFETGPEKGHSVRLEAERIYGLGRDESAEVRIQDELASGVHAKLRGKDDRFYLKDNASTNGTRVNDAPIDAMVELKSGDKITIGATTFTFLSDADAGGGIGRELGGYKLMQRLGRGGMGTVFRALQVSLNREVALKVLSPELSRDPSFVQQFHREARAAAQLNHPNVVQVYDVGAASDLTFYSMEFMPGGTVEDRINRDGALPVEAALSMLEGAARGLQFAELKQIVHRDIKPDNLMLTETGSVKIADLGLAHGAQDEAASGIMGTPHFISPEQARRQKLDVRSDLYSLGASFYRMLTAKTMFHGEKAEEIILKQVKETPPSIRDERPEVPERVAAIHTKLVQKDPADRYQTAGDLIADIEAARTRRGSGRLALVAVTLVAIGAITFAVLKGDKEPNNQGTSETVVIQSEDPAAEAERLRLAKELATQEAEMTAMMALTTLKDRRVDMERPAYVDALRELAKAHPGTNVSRDLAPEIEQLQREIDAAAAALVAREAAVVAAVKKLNDAVAAAIAERRFASAAAAAMKRGDASPDIRDDPRIESALVAARQRVVDAATQAVTQSSASVRDAIASLDFDAAEAEQKRAIRFLDGVDALTDEAMQVPLAALRDGLLGFDREIDEALSSSRREALAADLAAVRAIDWDAHFDQIAGYRFADARAGLAPAIAVLQTAEYQAYLGSLAQDLDRAAAAMAGFKQAVSTGTLTSSKIQHPERTLLVEIHGIADDGLGVVVEITRSAGSSRSGLEFRSFDSAARCLDLLSSRRSDEDAVGIATAAFLVTQAAWARSSTTLRAQLLAYDQNVGWKTAQQVAVRGISFPDPLGARMESFLTAAGADAEALHKRIVREQEVRMKVLSALEPFLVDNPKVHFSEAARLLTEARDTFRDSAFLRASYPLFDDGQNQLALVRPSP